VAAVIARSPQQLVVNVHDAALTSSVMMTIRDCGQDFTPSVEGNTIYVAVPKATAKARETLIKNVKSKAEEYRTQIRNVRKLLLDDLKKLELPKDDNRKIEKDIQKLTDDAVAEINVIVTAKEKELNTI
jgi:ribosome recycling factor